ncbi:Glutamine synthetase nodule isozyme [Porphyridium purpureum]|uniref:Glutamine synthetase n=1 Tax=Porphyridium purpureum TaxID=35688 RepID=A0A5J4YTP0_PORPP|nr:Glutamine synthetase nodule isozyme [Porphyridium purpureum]|eukprot:POR7605..scf227_4
MAAFVGAGAAVMTPAVRAAMCVPRGAARAGAGRAAAAPLSMKVENIGRELYDQKLKDKYEKLDLGGQIFAEYVWLGGRAAQMVDGVPVCMDPLDIRSKTKVLSSAPKSVADLPLWNYDGSSTEQAPGTDSEVMLKPQAIFKDPFRGGNNILVLCDTYTPAGTPLPSNMRYPAAQIFDKHKDLVPWFGIEQEYTLLGLDGHPLGWPKQGYPAPQGPYYCGNGATRIYGRELAEAHAAACLYAGIKLSGVNAEVMMSQWEYQVGPCEGIESGDHIWMSRYIMSRMSEEYGIKVSLDVKPMPGEWNGAGCHTNFSTKPMREEGGYEIIKKVMENFAKKHEEHIKVYGFDNDKRLTGACETAPITKFSWGVANRGASVRIPRTTEAENKGYFEDRRPGSNICPYAVTLKIMETSLV